MDKPSWRIYLNNTIAYIIFRLLKLIFRQQKYFKNNLLFINTGNLGDSVISSLIAENESSFKSYSNIYLILKHKFARLYRTPCGKVNIIEWDYESYKYNFIYRIKFLREIRKIGAVKCINLTSARGVTADEIALLSGAKEIFCTNSNWRYLKKAFGSILDNQYTGILAGGILNEYDRTNYIISSLTGNNDLGFGQRNNEIFFTTSENKLPGKIKDYVVIAPFASINVKSYPYRKFREVIEQISKHINVVLIGSTEEGKEIDSQLLSERIINLAGIELIEAPSLIKNSKAFVGNDSGFTHMSLKLQVPMVAVIGGGCYGMYFPYKENSITKYLYHKMDCFGCEWRCIYDQPYCLTNLEPAQITNTVLELLAKQKLNN